jgi:hypothetical protein
VTLVALVIWVSLRTRTKTARALEVRCQSKQFSFVTFRVGLSHLAASLWLFVLCNQPVHLT